MDNHSLLETSFESYQKDLESADKVQEETFINLANKPYSLLTGITIYALLIVVAYKTKLPGIYFLVGLAKYTYCFIFSWTLLGLPRLILRTLAEKILCNWHLTIMGADDSLPESQEEIAKRLSLVHYADYAYIAISLGLAIICTLVV